MYGNTYQIVACDAQEQFVFVVGETTKKNAFVVARKLPLSPTWSAKGYYAIVRDSQGKLVFDSRKAIQQ